MEKLDRGEQSGLHRLLEVDSAKQQVLQGLARTVDRVDQLVVQRLAKHLVQGAEGDEGQGLEHRVQGDLLRWPEVSVRSESEAMTVRSPGGEVMVNRVPGTEVINIMRPRGEATDISGPWGEVVTIRRPRGVVTDIRRPRGVVMDTWKPRGVVRDIMRPRGEVTNIMGPRRIIRGSGSEAVTARSQGGEVMVITRPEVRA